MENGEDLRKLYDAVSSKFDIGTYDDFEKKMTTSEDRKKFYDVVSSKGFDLGDYNEYENRLKKKDGITSSVKSDSEVQSTLKSNDIIKLANEYANQSAIAKTVAQPIYTPGGGTITQTESKDTFKRLKEIDSQIKSAGFDSKEILQEFSDFPQTRGEIDIASLLQEKKDNPLSYERHKAAYKWQVPLFNKIREVEGEEGAAYPINTLLAQAKSGSYEDKRNAVRTAIELANKYIDNKDERKKVISNISLDKAFAYGLDSEDKNNAILNDERHIANGGPLNTYQINALQFLQDTNPELYETYNKYFNGVDVEKQKELWGNEDFLRGYEQKTKELENLGFNIQETALNEALTNIEKNAKTNGGLNEQELSQANRLIDQLKTVEQDKRDWMQRYPQIASIEADKLAQEALGQRSGSVKRFFLGVGENVDDVANFWGDILQSPFKSKEEKLIDDLEDLGNKKFISDVQRYTTTSNRLFQPEYLPEFEGKLGEKIEEIKKGDFDDKYNLARKAIINDFDLVSDKINPNAGKFNATSGAIFNTISDVGSEIFSNIALTAGTGGAGNISKVRKLSTLFGTIFSTTYSDYYKEAVEKNIPNPTTYAITHSAIEAATELINPDIDALKKIIKPKSTLGQIINNSGKEVWDDIARVKSGRFSKIFDAVKAAGREGLKNTKSEVFEEVIGQLGGNIVDVSAFNQDGKITDGLKETIVTTAIGTLPLSILGIPGAIKNMNSSQKYALYEAAQNPDRYKFKLAEDVKNGIISEQKAKIVKDIIDRAAYELKYLSDNNTINIDQTDKEKADKLSENTISFDRAKEEAKLLVDLREKAGEFEKDADLKYFIDKAGEAPAQYYEKYGKEITDKLLESVSTEKLQKNIDDLISINPDNPNIPILDKIIDKRLSETEKKQQNRIRVTADQMEANQPKPKIRVTAEEVESLQPDKTEVTEETKVSPTESISSNEAGMTGITHEETNKIADEFGLSHYNKDPQTIEEWDKEAEERISKNPNAVNELLDKYRNEGYPSPVEQRMMAKVIASLRAVAQENPTPENIKELKRVIDLSDIVGGRFIGQSLVARKGLRPIENTLGDYIIQWTESKGIENPTQENINEATERFNKMNDLKSQIETAREEGRQQAIKEIAEKKISNLVKSKKTTKKSAQQYSEERTSILKKMREDLQNVAKGGQGTMMTIPGAPQLAAIAPHVAKLVKSYVEQGIDNLDVIVSNISEDLKDILKITPAQIRDIIAGEYTEKKETHNDIQAKIRLLEKEAELLKKIEDERLGLSKVTESKRVEKNERIKELEAKLAELKNKNKELEEDVEEAGNKSEGELNKELRGRLLKKIAALKERIKNKDYAEEEKKDDIPLKLDEKTKRLMDEYVNLKREDALQKAKYEYSKLSKSRKVWDKIWQILGLRRLVQTAIDFSIPFRQAIGITINPFKLKTTGKAFGEMFLDTVSQKGFRRRMYELMQTDKAKEFVHFGGVFSEPDEMQLDKREEEFRTSIIGSLSNSKNPWLQFFSKVWFSERAAAGFLNIARIEQYKAMTTSLESKGLTPENDPEAYKDAVKWIMNMTGRGNMLKLIEDSHAGRVTANNTFFGARLMASRFNILNPVYYYKMPKEVRVEAAKDMIGYISGLFLIGLGLVAAGGKVSFDPDDPDFMKVRFGNGVYDITGGMGVYVRTYLRLIKAIYKGGHAVISSDKKVDREAKKYAGFAAQSTWKAIVANKLSPNTSYAYHFLTQKGGDGGDFDPAEILKVYPLYIDDTIDGFKNSGPVSLATVLLPALLGVGVQEYPEKKGYEKEDLKDPTFKYFLDKGMELPNTVPQSIKIKDPKLKQEKKLSEYDDDFIKKYMTIRKDNLRDELKRVIRKGYVYVDKYGGISMSGDAGEKRLKLDQLNEDQLAQVLSLSARKATTKTKENIFK